MKLNFAGLVLFLEEDHYVAEDFLHLLNLMQKQAKVLCSKCNIFSLGEHSGNTDDFFDMFTEQKTDEVFIQYPIKTFHLINYKILLG